jgi:prepilin peptidase CpaA
VGVFSVHGQFNTVHAMHWGVVIACCVIAAVTDLRSRRIPNSLTGPMFLAGLAWSLATAGFSGLGDSALAAVVLALPYVILFLIAGGGAADAKLMAAVGAWVGFHEGIVVLLCVCISGAIIGLGYAFIKGQARGVLANLILMILALFTLVVGRRSLKDVGAQFPDAKTMLSIPYGLAILTGVCVAAAGAFAASYWI